MKKEDINEFEKWFEKLYIEKQFKINKNKRREFYKTLYNVYIIVDENIPTKSFENINQVAFVDLVLPINSKWKRIAKEKKATLDKKFAHLPEGYGLMKFENRNDIKELLKDCFLFIKNYKDIIYE